MKKLFLTLAMALVAVVSFAYDAEVDGIYYNLNKVAKTSEVTYGILNYLGGEVITPNYSGEVVIPEQITVDGAAFTGKAEIIVLTLTQNQNNRGFVSPFEVFCVILQKS